MGKETDAESRRYLETAGLVWFSEPPAFTARSGQIRVRTGDQKDFWRETFYGFVHDDGHFLGTEVTGDFSATVTVRGDYESLYDQAGLMLRIDERNWVKAGIEYTDGQQHFSVVATRETSDWSVIPLPGNPDAIDIRLTRHAEAVRVQYRLAGDVWRMARLAYLPPVDPARVGPVCCSPTRADFTVAFDGFAVGEPISRSLHD